MVEYVALIVSLISLIVSVFFAVRSMQFDTKANELSESQKTAALISIISPACETPEQWKMFIRYLSKNERLPFFSEEDEFFLQNVLDRLSIKARIVNGKLKLEN